jgi:hypothetical protein
MGVLNAIGRAVGSVFGGGGRNPAAAGDSPASAGQAARFASMVSYGVPTAPATWGANPWAPTGATPGAPGVAGLGGIGLAHRGSAMPAQVALPVHEPQAKSQSPLGPASGQTQEARQQSEREEVREEEVRDEEVRERRADEKQRKGREQTEDEFHDKTDLESLDRAEAVQRWRDERRLQDLRLVHGGAQVRRVQAGWQLPQQSQDPAVRAGQ